MAERPLPIEPPSASPGWFARWWGHITGTARYGVQLVDGASRSAGSVVVDGAAAVSARVRGTAHSGVQAVRHATVDRLTSGIEGVGQRLTRRVLGLLARLALILSFATTSSVLMLVGLFTAFGVDLVELVDRGTLLQSIALHAIAIGSIVILTRALAVIAEDRGIESAGAREATYAAPLALAFAAMAFWYLEWPLALGVTVAVLLLAGLLSRISRTLMLIVVTLAFLGLGFGRAVTLYRGEPSALLTRDGRTMPFQIVITGERGILGLSGEPRTMELVPWEHVQSLRSRHLRGWLGMSPISGGAPPRRP